MGLEVVFFFCVVYSGVVFTTMWLFFGKSLR